MAEVTDKDPLALRGRILKEFEKVQAEIATKPELWRKWSFEAHERLREAMGVDFLDYPELEFWFSRFLQGNFELDYDRSSDPKARSIIDLPLDVFNKIGEYLQLKDRMHLRDVCKDFRYQVDNWDLKLDEIFYNGANEWRVTPTLGQRSFWVCNYGQNEENIFSYCPYRNPTSFVMGALKLPKLQVDKLTILDQDIYWNELIEELNKSNQKLHVKKVEFPFYSSKIDLHFMIPTVLEEITMVLWNPTREEMSKIIESEQCQSAKMVYIESGACTSRFPLDALYNCPRFTLRLREKPADGLKSKFLKALMKYGDVKKCVLYAEREILSYFNEPEVKVPNFPSLRRYPISGTNDFYELEHVVEVNRYRHQEEFVSLERKH
ncbi:hypothetical protein GCK72_021197 [Caenorhabditis remanei]|uniref:F-box domain-containing protein n=1 Tax=Caenorhabditis remanei TaxID=31234 RepID=A0A6A5GIL5_CAERE|nr:hypothetical protein GCK72_021197 [Caenorhabditis remanei]KAF1754634.1 hypothetical protein GCK72_021197 [Caenorhabditis remanei]